MKAIIHIGTPKTGTTSAQSWLSQNRQNLQNNGVFYPSSLGEHHHIRLATACRLANRPERGFKLFNIKNESDHKSFSQETFYNFEKEIENVPQSNTCLISSEWLYNRLDLPEEIRALRTFLDNFFDEFKIVIWLRPQVDYIVSMASTISRTGAVFNRKRLEALRTSPELQYDTILSRWEKEMGKQNVTVLPYKREKNVIKKLLTFSGSSMEPDARPTRENSRLSLNLIHLGNQIRLPHANRVFDPGWDRRKYFENIESTNPLKISRAFAETINAGFANQNSAVVDRHEAICLNDLDPEWKKYGDTGNLDRLGETAPFSSELTQLVRLMNADLQIQRALTEIAEAEISILRGEDGFRRLAQAERYINSVNDNCYLSERLVAARKKLRRLKGNL
ncbi:hypothetical protein CLV80_1253 [Yoonia maritima]|uniref:Sulfotransferase family protein n=1 Tax=Yoonia maritima TaxID=1435347 RepID=A0A2T0VT36_9RHOB|nr:hypothetical protein [Yoonia maritima]PRY73924.1 hypothetical protein CLV80_1253 [Yoonia maritima]